MSTKKLNIKARLNANRKRQLKRTAAIAAAVMLVSSPLSISAENETSPEDVDGVEFDLEEYPNGPPETKAGYVEDDEDDSEDEIDPIIEDDADPEEEEAEEPEEPEEEPEEEAEELEEEPEPEPEPEEEPDPEPEDDEAEFDIEEYPNGPPETKAGFVEDEDYWEAYYEGYDVGYEAGYTDDYSEGDFEGYAEGYEDGYNDGYRDCQEDETEYWLIDGTFYGNGPPETKAGYYMEGIDEPGIDESMVKVSQEEAKVTKEDGKILPSTATSIFKWLLGGLVAIVGGAAGLFTRKRKKDSK